MMDELREPTNEERERDIKFLTTILVVIRDYAKEAGQDPDDILRAVADWINTLLQIATFNNEGE